MGQFGFPLSVPLGEHDSFIKTFTWANLGDGPMVTFQPVTGYDQYYTLQVDGKIQGLPVWAAAGSDTSISGIWQTGDTEHVISIVPQGDWSGPLDLPYQQESFLSARAERLHVTIDTVPDFVAYGASSQFASWALTGLKRFSNCSAHRFRPSWGILEITMTTAGDHTVNLLANGRLVASGTRTGDGSVTLTEQNSSGLSGTVTLTYSGDIASGSYLIARFPKELKVHYKISAFTAPDFPRTAEITLYDDGKSNEFLTFSSRLAAGTYRVVSHQRDENANESTGLFAGGATQVIVTPPAAPSALAYSSGGYAATIISWTGIGGTDTYNIYDSEDDDFLDMLATPATHAAGSGTLTQTLAAVASNYTGKRYVVVRSVTTGSVEEGNLEILTIEYVSGVVVAARPNAPQVGTNVTTSGRTLTIPIKIPTADKLADAHVVQLFLFDPDGSIDYDSPDAAVGVELDSNGDPVEYSNVSVTQVGATALSIAATAASNVRRKFACRTATKIGDALVIEGDASSQLASWVITGEVLANTNGGLLYWTLTDAAGTRTLNIYKDLAHTDLVATGTSVGDGAVTLAASGGSGLTGSATVTYSGDDTDSANLIRTNTQSDNTDTYGPIELTTATPSDPTQTVRGGL